ncbi:hypothetical protein B0A49_09631 [Cryomyces minteri]|uniref:Uncharacterized protein n=1 Tax=Cryomyces minteri TaxID=331657 RepID=A0A4U0W485_9PEZI|nr:hypothetical protein B0A49_09631 [Cryomyces minteri]
MGWFTPSNSHSSSHHSSSHGYSSRPSYSRASSSYNTRSSSYYKRRPRSGYIALLLHRLKQLLRDLWNYARRHPVKAFLAVIVPLISAGGALSGLAAQFGVRLPPGLAAMAGGGGGSGGWARRGGGGGYYGSRGFGEDFGRGGWGGGSGLGNLGSLMKVAKAFM